MSKWVPVTAAQRKLGGLIREDVQAKEGPTGLVSIEREKRLPAFVREVAREIRSDKGKYARVRGDQLVDRAMSEAMAVWRRFNPPGRGVDSKYLSNEETRRIGRANAGLGRLTRRARDLAKSPNFAPPDVVRAAKRAFENQPLDGHVPHFDLSRADVRALLPPAVLEARDFYYENVERADWGTVRVWETSVGVGELHPVFVVHVTTDGSDGYLELYDERARPIASGIALDEALHSWDASFGDVRRVALGEVPPPWRG